MCGIDGFWGAFPRPLLDAMSASIAHRGPHVAGSFFDAEATVGLADALRTPLERATDNPTLLRDQISAWASYISDDAPAGYFERLIAQIYAGAKRPTAPWRRQKPLTTQAGLATTGSQQTYVRYEAAQIIAATASCSRSGSAARSARNARLAASPSSACAAALMLKTDPIAASIDDGVTK